MDYARPAAASLVDRIRAEYREMPGLRLTLLEAARFWGVDPLRCQDLLHELLASGFLTRSADGAYYFVRQD